MRERWTYRPFALIFIFIEKYKTERMDWQSYLCQKTHFYHIENFIKLLYYLEFFYLFMYCIAMNVISKEET